MPQWHGDIVKRKKTGGKRRAYRGKRAFEIGSEPVETTLGERKIVKKPAYGGNLKIKLLSCKFANVTDPSTRTTRRVEISRVVGNQSNVDFERRGVITRGAIIETQLGQARVTSRPGQDGVINAVLIKPI
ncbi:MAG: 30S ribosomal protein S8e [Candidatus Bathyarchaeia archaeon]